MWCTLAVEANRPMRAQSGDVCDWSVRSVGWRGPKLNHQSGKRILNCSGTEGHKSGAEAARVLSRAVQIVDWREGLYLREPEILGECHFCKVCY